MRLTRQLTANKIHKDIWGIVLLVAISLPAPLLAENVTIPNEFKNGEIADANEVNANFTALADAVNDNDDRIIALVAAVEALQARVTALETEQVVLQCVAGTGSPGRRYLDQLDGTVLDCNTGLVWLKDASCADLAETDAEGLANWDTAKNAAAALADGTCGLTDGSVAGDWRLPTIGEFCSRDDIPTGAICPLGNASNSLIDSSLGPPTVVNTAGTGVWIEGDPFFGVQSTVEYWSFSIRQSEVDETGIANLSDGVVSFTSAPNVIKYVWPVRD